MMEDCVDFDVQKIKIGLPLLPYLLGGSCMIGWVPKATLHHPPQASILAQTPVDD
jgi:hypothetical protein